MSVNHYDAYVCTHYINISLVYSLHHFPRSFPFPHILMIPIMSTRSMALAGLRTPRSFPFSLTFAPSKFSPLPIKHRKLDPIPPSAVPNCKEVLLVRTEEPEIKAGYCCPAHSQLFDLDFESDDEEVTLKARKKTGKLAFLAEIPFESKHYLLVKRDVRDAGTQHEAGNEPALVELASAGVVASDDSACAVVQCRGQAGPWHLAEYTQSKIPATALWNQFPEVPMSDTCPIECPHCSQRFASGQALGGHTSRRHSSKRPAALKRLRRNSALIQ